jgi:uncharacterized protein
MDEHSQNGHASKGRSAAASTTPNGETDPGMPDWLSRHAWVPFVVPFVVFMVCGAFEPTPEKPFELLGLVIDYAKYPAVYTVKILLTLAALAVVWPGLRQFPFRVSAIAPLVGALGVVVWVGICKLELEANVLGPLGLADMIGLGKRSAFNPLEQLSDTPLAAYGFLAVRFLGLVLVVPLIEEFFIRGFVMRYVIDADWWKVPFGTLTPAAIAAGTLLPVLMHPAELVAAAVWFSLITWLMHLTKNIWDCVVAHAVTNLLLGLWVLASDDWYFL